MKIKKHLMGPLQSNCYVVWDEASLEAMVIDPGAKAGKLAATIAEKSLTPKAVIQTHGHWDHSAGSLALCKLLGAPLLRHPEDGRAGRLHRKVAADGEKVIDLHHGDPVRLGALLFEVIHTPGHSRGSICLYGEGVLFSGDLLFRGGVGRFDLKGGSFRELVKSLNERLAGLPDDVDVLPGHGPATTLGAERRANPFFKSARMTL